MVNWFGHGYPYTNFHELNLDWIIEQVKQCLETIDRWSETAQELEQALQDLTNIQTRLTNVEILANGLRSELTSFENTVNTKLATNDAQIEDLYNQYRSLKTRVDNFSVEFNNVYAYIDTEIAKLDRSVDNRISNALFNIYMPLTELQNRVDELEKIIANINTSVINPWHYERGSISPNKNNKFIYNDLADECLTASEYCKLGLSATDYSNRDITARDYAEFGKDKLHFRWAYSPAYGFKQEISNVLTSIINFNSNTISSDEYTALDLTADDYTALDITASDYYSYRD